MLGKPDFYQFVVLAMLFWLGIGIAAAAVVVW